MKSLDFGHILTSMLIMQNEILSLPMSPVLKEEEVNYVIKTINKLTTGTILVRYTSGNLNMLGPRKSIYIHMVDCDIPTCPIPPPI